MVIERRKADSNSDSSTSCNSARLADSNGSNPSSICTNFPDDLLIGVLSRLPWKTLLKFTFVSKSWRNLICNFMSTSPISPTSSLLLYSPYAKRFQDISMDLLGLGCSTRDCLEVLQSHYPSLRTSYPKIEVIHYCNGFLLFDEGCSRRSYYACNPATNQCVYLPKPLRQRCSTWPANHSALVFDLQTSSHFKVIYMFRNSNSQASGQIFSSDKNKWVSFSAYLAVGCTQCHFMAKQSIYLNGALHYLDHLDVCHAAVYPARLQMWMMESFDTGKWFKKHTLHIANVENAIFPSFPFNYCRAMAFHTNLDLLFIWDRDVVYSYYFGSGGKDPDRLKEVCSVCVSFVDFVFPYSPCLASLNDICNQRSQRDT